MRIFRLGERVKAPVDNIQIGTVQANKSVIGRIIAFSPDRKVAKLLLDNDTELLIETRFLR